MICLALFELTKMLKMDWSTQWNGFCVALNRSKDCYILYPDHYVSLWSIGCVGRKVNMLPSLECNKCLHREPNTGPQDDWFYTSVLQYPSWAIKNWHHRSSQFDPKVSIIMLILVRIHTVTLYSILITADHTTGVKCHENNENMGSNCCVFDESSFVWTWHAASCIMTKEKDTMVYVCAIGSQIIIFKILHVTSTEKLWCVFFYKLFFIVGL